MHSCRANDKRLRADRSCRGAQRLGAQLAAPKCTTLQTSATFFVMLPCASYPLFPATSKLSLEQLINVGVRRSQHFQSKGVQGLYHLVPLCLQNDMVFAEARLFPTCFFAPPVQSAHHPSHVDADIPRFVAVDTLPIDATGVRCPGHARTCHLNRSRLSTC